MTKIGAADFTKNYLNFLDKARTEKRAVREITAAAAAAGFETPDQKAKGKRAERFVFNLDDRCGALVSIGDPKSIHKGFRILATHVDSPRIDLKPNPLYEKSGLFLLKTRYYGGIKNFHWVGIPLALCGTIVDKSGARREMAVGLEDGDPVITISDIAPHLAARFNEKSAQRFIPAESLNAIVGLSADKNGRQENALSGFRQLLKDKYDLSEIDFQTSEFEIVPAVKPSMVGLDSAYIGGYGHDNRLSTYAALTAFLDSADQGRNTIFVYFDKEEIGSQGVHGADSNLIERVMLEIFERMGNDSYMELRRSINSSICISGDVTVGIDPTWDEVTEANNTARMGQGVSVIKYTGARGKRGASEADASLTAALIYALEEDGVPWQTGEIGKVDAGGGGTVAHYLARIGIRVIDCGAPVLGMHSPFELTASDDLTSCARAYASFLQSPLLDKL